MKITDPDIIKNGEKDLIDSVKDDLDLDVVKQILKRRIAASALSAKGGQIVVHNNEIAFKMDFDLNLSGSLMFDREGNYISEDSEAADQDVLDIDEQEIDSIDIDPAVLDDEDTVSDEKAATPPPELIDDSDLDLDLEDDLNIELPDYDLDDSDPAENNIDENDLDEDRLDEDESPEVDSLQTEPEPEDFDQLADDLDLDDSEELSDDGIDDILKESQEFWDQKKE